MRRALTTLTIKSNHQERPVLHAWDIPEDVWKDEFDYHGEQDSEEASWVGFFKYKGQYYDMSQFSSIPYMAARVGGHIHLREGFEEWDAYQSDSAFSGMLYRHPIFDEAFETDYVIVGRYYS